MTIYYSATTNAFYDSQVYNTNNIPEDKVTVSASTYKNLMAQQCAGRVIVAAANGTPTTIAQTCGPCTSTKYATKTEVAETYATKKEVAATYTTKTELTNGLAGKADKSHTHSDLATKTELTNGLAAKANDNAVVHTSGAETVNGAKTFTSNPIVENTNPLFLIKNSNVDKGTNPTSNIYSGLWLNDKNGTASKNRIAGLGAEINTAGCYRSYLCAYKPVAGASDYSQISISYAADGTVTTSAPTPPADDNSTQIATTAWVTAKDNNVVHKTGNESVTGIKTFTSAGSGSAALLFKPGTFKKGDITDGHVSRIYHGDAANYANALHIYETGTTDNGDRTYTNFVTVTNTAGISNTTNRTTLTISFHKNPSDGRKQYATLSGDFLPSAANTYNLGSESNPWATLQAKTGVFEDDVWVGGDQLIITSDETEVFTGRRISWAKNADTLPTKAYNLNFSLGGNNSNAWANRIGGFRVALNTIGDVETAMYAHDTTGASKGQGMIGIYYRRATDSYETIAPTPPAGDNSTQIATTAWSRSNFITLDTDQTITGLKAFSGHIGFTNANAVTTIWKKAQTDKGTVPSTTQGLAFVLADSTGNTNWVNRLAHLNMQYEEKTGNTSATLTVFNTTSNSTQTNGRIGIYYDKASDTFTTYAPTPPANDNSTQIATTAWVNTAKATIPQNYLGRQPKTFKTLWAGHFASDSVTLSEPFTNYKWLLVKLSNDDDWGMHYHYISTYDLNKMLNGESHNGYVNKSVTLGGSYLYWNIHTYANGSTTTYFSYEDDNCRLREIIGINEFY